MDGNWKGASLHMMIVGQSTLYGKARRVYIKSDSPRANLDQHILSVKHPLAPAIGKRRSSGWLESRSRLATRRE